LPSQLLGALECEAVSPIYSPYATAAAVGHNDNTMATEPPPVPDGAKSSIKLTGAQETLMVALQCRIADFNLAKPILRDPWATYCAAQIDYDFAALGVQPRIYSTVALRGRVLDEWTTAFLARHPEGATVLHLACGLDSRSHRVAWGDKVRWIDVDLPDVVELRKRLLPNPPGDYTLLAASVTDESFPATVANDRPTVVIFEGLAMYLDPEPGKAMISRLSKHFASGELLFDASGRVLMAVQSSVAWLRKTGAEMKWAIDDPKELEHLHTTLKLQDDWPSVSMEGVREFPTQVRIEAFIMARLPGMRTINRLLRYTF
jgi:O-methyltransferase involved in polyketide biosynthesis